MVYIRCIHGVCTVYVRYIYGVCTVCIRYMYGVYTVHVWCMYGVCTVYIRYMYGVCTVAADSCNCSIVLHRSYYLVKGTVLFCVITQRVVAICYRRFGTTFRHLKTGQYVVPKRR